MSRQPYAKLRAGMSRESRARSKKRAEEILRWDHFSLAELQLLQLGLWIIGEQDRVDWKLMRDYRNLVVQLKDAAQQAIGMAPSSPVAQKDCK